jgi:RimJ/RimL family protein N-acetyltransferase
MFEMRHRALIQTKWRFGGLLFRPLYPWDIEKIRRWRNSQTKYLRQEATISRLGQVRYFFNSAIRDMKLERPDKVLLGIESKGELVGYCGLVHVDWFRKEAEVSFLLSDAKISIEAYKEIMTSSLRCLCEVANSLSLEKLKTETYVYPERKNHIQNLESFGFSKTPMSEVAHKGIQSIHHVLKLREGK